MIVVDTSIWIDHFRQRDERLAGLLDAGRICMHPFIIGELAMGSLRNRRATIEFFCDLPPLARSEDRPFLARVDRHGLFSKGLSFVDAHILCALMEQPQDTLWTRDKRLKAAATDLALKVLDEAPH